MVTAREWVSLTHTQGRKVTESAVISAEEYVCDLSVKTTCHLENNLEGVPIYGHSNFLL